jgi:hypothetical protein
MATKSLLVMVMKDAKTILKKNHVAMDLRIYFITLDYVTLSFTNLLS